MVKQIEDAGDVRDLLQPVWELFESGLGTELDDQFFVPTVVQTLVYGLFAAWLTSESTGDEFDWQSAAYEVEVPLFADVLHLSLRPRLIRKCNLLPRLAAVAGVLKRVDRVRFSGALDHGAIEYFYEPFLARFDERLRDQLGVWYTPREIAEYQVAQCDLHLRRDLGIGEGLADPSVIILDPAVGTGTYLACVYRSIYDRHIANGEPASVAAARLKEAATTRVIGFEILPAAFIIGHLHLTRVLADHAAMLTDLERVRVYLTNSLTGWDPARNDSTMVLFPELEEELEYARSVKQREPILVVLGNPPYEGYSSAESAEERELIAPWITPLWPVWGVRKHRLNDLYARFWKAASDRIHLTGRGVVSFITNRQWLAGRSYPEMRADLLRTFDSLTIEDLHGDVHDRTHIGDQSVFTTATAPGIRVGTAIVTACKTSEHDAPASVRVRNHRGAADSKRAMLRSLTDGSSVGLDLVPTSAARKWRLTADLGTSYPYLDEYFGELAGVSEPFWSGVQTVRDVVMDEDLAALQARMAAHFDSFKCWAALIHEHPGFDVARSGYNPQQTRSRLLAGSALRAERFVRFLYRPMVARWIYWEPDHKLLNRPRPSMMPFYINRAQQRALVVPQTRRRDGAARPLVASQVVCMEAVDPNARVFPLWQPAATTGLRPDELGYDPTALPVTTLGPEWIAAARTAGVPGSYDDVEETIFYALAGVAASGEWLTSQDIQSGDFPQIPIPASPAHLIAAAEIGRRYAELVDPDIQVAGVTTGAIRAELRSIGVPDAVTGPAVLTYGTAGVDGGRRVNNDLLWDSSHGWRDIPDEVWRYRLGGFSPLTKWLAYRVNTDLTPDDRHTVMHLVRRLYALHLLQADADAVYSEAHARPLVT